MNEVNGKVVALAKPAVFDQIKNNHMLHAGGIGLVTAAAAKSANVSRRTRVMLVVGVSASAYLYMVMFGHGVPWDDKNVIPNKPTFTPNVAPALANYNKALPASRITQTAHVGTMEVKPILW